MLGVPLMLTLLVGTWLETALAERGFEATVVDSSALWAQERERATRLGRQGVVLIGSSRIQLGVDVSLLTTLVGRPVAQLAIDGSSFVPILRGLAEDPKFTGTAVVDYLDDVVEILDREDAASEYQRAFERRQGARSTVAEECEALLERHVQRNLRAYADGATPWGSLVGRVMAAEATPQYLATFPDRSRAADFGKVAMPQFYWQRVKRNLAAAGVHGSPPETELDVERSLMASIDEVQEAAGDSIVRNARVVREWVDRIHDRGGRVVFLVMPTSGLVRALERKRYPRHLFWDSFVTTATVDAVHFEDHVSLRAFDCPDGSHLDRRDKPAFTEALAKVLFPPTRD